MSALIHLTLLVIAGATASGSCPPPASVCPAARDTAAPPVVVEVRGDGARAASRDTARVVVDAAPDTVHRRPRVVEVSDWYSRRLTIHRALSYTVIPLFAGQWIAGHAVLQQGNSAPEWAKLGHRTGATALAGVFTVNTVTGLWNLWDSRQVPEGRTLRTVHALSMLAADGGFTYAGAVLAKRADTDRTGQVRYQHRNLALASMGLTVGSALMMKLFNH